MPYRCRCSRAGLGQIACSCPVGTALAGLGIDDAELQPNGGSEPSIYYGDHPAPMTGNTRPSGYYRPATDTRTGTVVNVTGAPTRPYIVRTDAQGTRRVPLNGGGAKQLTPTRATPGAEAAARMRAAAVARNRQRIQAHTARRAAQVEMAQAAQAGDFPYTREQLLEMLARGRSETFERSGESDTGLPFADDAESKARAEGATAAFGARAGEPVPPEPAERNPLVPWVVLGALAYLLV